MNIYNRNYIRTFVYICAEYYTQTILEIIRSYYMTRIEKIDGKKTRIEKTIKISVTQESCG